jgi:flavin reductase (DIM6/NTAB) family NADH-FMN oxidoreductase RutF/DNA-binding IclR family transcriptional regulator
MTTEPTDARWFRQVLGQYPTGVCVVTATQGDGTRAGFVVGSFSSVSLDPPLVAFFPDKGSTSWPKIEAAGSFCVNILGAEQEDVCRRFASKAPDKFEGIPCRPAGSGAPIVEGAVAWIDCDLERVEEAGDHFFVVGRVRGLDVESKSLPLLFFQGGYGRFAPLSLAAANPGGTLTDQLRDVDLVRREMESLAEAVSGRCIATARIEDELVVTASAGGSNTTSAATLVGQRLPFAPPTGSAFSAWGDADEVAAWLAAAKSDTARDYARERLAAVRRRGYSVGLLNEAQRTFASTIDRLAAEPGSISSEDLRALIQDLAYDPVDLSPQVKNNIRIITAPVFGRHGEVALALTLYGFPNPSNRGGIDTYIARVVEAARRATERLGGHAPMATPELTKPPRRSA